MSSEPTNRVFIDTSKSPLDISAVDTEHYSTTALLGACDSPFIVLSSPDKSGEKIVDCVSFIVRTFKGNKAVCSTETKTAVFKCGRDSELPDGITLSDYMLAKAHGLLTEMLYDYKPMDIALNAMPTPFGIIKNHDGTSEALFQIVVNDEVLENLNEGFSYVPVKDLEDNKEFKKILPQFKYTKEE